MDTMEQHQELEQEAIGPALPPPSAAQKSELFEEHNVEYELINGIPCYQPDHVVDGQVQIFERIGYDDKVGGTFLGLSADGKELVVRVAPIDALTHVVRAEAAFLCKVEAELQDWRLFSQVHKIFLTDDAWHMSLYFRGGPTLEQCFAMRNKFTLGTAGRLAEDVLNVIRCAHKHGYLVRNMDLNSFHYDAASRHLFMADISSLVKNISGDDGAPIASYAGCLDYAPCSDDGLVGARQDLETWFYQLVHLVLGELPWGSLSREEAGVKKAEFQKSKEFAELPEVFHKIAEVVIAKEYSVVEEEEYVKLAGLTEQIYKELGGVTDHEENMDFEREPTPDELPRFVACRADEIPTIAEEEEPAVEEENSE
ncbi:Protein kinase domain-containing protein [Caenorhabditis elegans]|uniref:Protein kinase domain-containing protein n=1 Tax=Caenorhabditis elegans TaxID=6239 RepID=Q9NAP8_CAEEL|nr:Protein kinase domain-containing protein [Caenorhabditis elegans]CAB70168.1 Protein kinase domain-containing protein [Caenorhabditis elegans]|eukprot:NP_496952.1 Uncharacterized protein CELE_K09E4.1 [Caenorhabditis elegans]